MEATNFEVYLSGEKLYGDEFTPEQISEWFKGESEGYADLGARDKSDYHYGYHELNKYHSFKYLGNRPLNDVLGFGSAYGDEFLPIVNRIRHITVLDPSDAFSGVTQIQKTPCKYVKPNASGDMPFESNRFDLITSFGVMHHIPNVSHVMRDMYRCLSIGGILLIREPIVSMGDWRKPRPGCTLSERGIPIRIFDKIIGEAGFKVKRRALCDFRLVPILAGKVGIDAYNSKFAVKIDSLISSFFPWKTKYHRTTILEKLAPASVAYVLEKE